MHLHIPVLLPEILEALQLKPGQAVIDATFGAGGYTKAFLETNARVIAFDRDPNAIKNGQSLADASDGKLVLIHAPFSQMKDELAARGVENVDAIAFDFGVSSMQLDEAERGFSFLRDGPLDMRMSRQGKSAADIVNTFDEKEIANILFQYGEEKRSRAIARAIVAQREIKKISTTLELANLVEKTIGRDPRSKIHPATRSFQGLRIAVNEELQEIEKTLASCYELLPQGGQVAAVTFHSLEDRIVKKFFAKQKSASRHAPETWLAKDKWRVRKLITPSTQETHENARARSAKLRIAAKI